MKNLKLLLIIIIPLFLFAVNHLIFAYGQANFNLTEWSEDARTGSAFIAFWLVFLGIVLGVVINVKQFTND